MNTNDILDDNFNQDEPNKHTQEFQPLYDAYLGNLTWAFRWGFSAAIITLISFVSYLIYREGGGNAVWQITVCLLFAAAITAGLGYLYYYFALKKSSLLSYLFPKIEMNRRKIYSPWLLFALFAIITVVVQKIPLPYSSNYIFASVLNFIMWVIILHTIIMIIQYATVKIHIFYLPCIFDNKPFPNLSNIGFLWWMITVGMSGLIVVIAEIRLEILLPPLIFGFFLNFYVGYKIRSVHKSAQVQKEKEDKSNPINN